MFNVFGSRTLGYWGDKLGLIARLREGRIGFLNQPALRLMIGILRSGFSPFGVYNFLVLLSFPLTCFFSYRFFCKVLGNGKTLENNKTRPSGKDGSFYLCGDGGFLSFLSFVLALIFTFSPYHIYKSYNHVDLAQIWVFPLFFSALLDFDYAIRKRFLSSHPDPDLSGEGSTARDLYSRGFFTPDRSGVQNDEGNIVQATLRLSVVMAGTTLISNYYGYFTLLIIAIYFTIELLRNIEKYVHRFELSATDLRRLITDLRRLLKTNANQRELKTNIRELKKDFRGWIADLRRSEDSRGLIADSHRSENEMPNADGGMRMAERGLQITSYLLLVASYVLFTVPFLLPYIRGIYFGDTGGDEVVARVATGVSRRDVTDFVAFSARPWYYIVPSIDHPIFGNFAQGVHDWFESTGYFLFDDFFWEEHSAVYLGIVNLILTGYAIYKLFWAKRTAECGVENNEYGIRKEEEMVDDKLQISNNEKNGRGTSYDPPAGGTNYISLFFWLGVGLFILSMPPFISLGFAKIYLPSYLLMKVFPMFRTISRLGLPLLLCVLVLTGYGLQLLKERFSLSRTSYLLLVTSYCFLALFEFYFPPVIKKVPPGGWRIDFDIISENPEVREVNIIEE